ncbi:hypothetical protein [Falsiroseomonas sp. HW251]|uniref:hypothetical protein n=1 Tax=Falsiroseomonas sp. HW251 TaxID=3390998 RepID=UPI003D31F8D8
MPTLRIEARRDAATGLFYLAIHMPAEAEQPYVTTAPRYASAAAAEQDFVATVAAAANRPRQSMTEGGSGGTPQAPEV